MLSVVMLTSFFAFFAFFRGESTVRAVTPYRRPLENWAFLVGCLHFVAKHRFAK
jgi:hypothetical protein